MYRWHWCLSDRDWVSGITSVKDKAYADALLYSCAVVRLTVSLRINDDDFTMTWETFKFVFLNAHNLALWVIPLSLAVILRVITHKFHHQLIFPLCAYYRFVSKQPLADLRTGLDFIVIPVMFYVVVAAAGLDLAALRASRWVFDMGTASQNSWYEFYSYLGQSCLRL
jgi:sulfate permease, SulP family